MIEAVANVQERSAATKMALELRDRLRSLIGEQRRTLSLAERAMENARSELAGLLEARDVVEGVIAKNLNQPAPQLPPVDQAEFGLVEQP